MADTELKGTKPAPAAAAHGAPLPSSVRVKTFSSLSNSVFRLYFIAMLCQTAAFNMNQITNPLLVYRITGSAALLGVVSMAGSVPHIFFALYGGVIADRMHKKHVLAISLASFTAVSVIMALLLTFGVLNKNTWWILAVSGVFQASLMGLMIPARHAIIREIVGGPLLMNAVALNTMGANGFLLLAPAAAGFIIDGFGFNTVYFFVAGFYALGAVFVSLMPRTGQVTVSRKSPLQDIIGGFKYIGSDRNILFILLFFLFTVLLSWPFRQLIAIFADDVLKVGAKGMGILMSVSGAGAIAGSLVLASLPGRKRGVIMLLGTLGLGISLAAFSFSTVWALSLGIMVLIGLGQTAQMTLSNTLAQHYTSDQFRGRVMGVYDMQMSFVGPSVYLAGLLTEVIGIQRAFGSFAILVSVIALFTLLFVPRLRRLD